MTDVTRPTTAPAPGGAAQSASSTTAAAKDQAASVASSAASEAKSVASDAAAEAKYALSDARQQLRGQAEEQSAKVASTLGDLGGQLRRMAEAGESGTARDVISSVADRAEQMSQRLRDGGLDRTLEDARRFARNRPGMFLAGAALAGFVAARVVRVADTDSLKQAATPSNGSSGSFDREPGAELGGAADAFSAPYTPPPVTTTAMPIEAP